MSGGVFVLNGDGRLVSMKPASFALEEDFQKLLADFPELLSGDQINPASPRKWLLVTQEKSVPSEEGGAGRWAADHLFIDQDGVPTIVEVKRKSDTRLRREVVGQMLDYAANAVAYWPIEELRSEFERSCRDRGKSPQEEMESCLGPQDDFDPFWKQVKANLLAGRVRLLFVADRIPQELQRVVEFLNKQMDPAEVLALELCRFEGEGLNTIVPVLYGRTQEAEGRKGTRSAREWTEAEALELLASKHGQGIAAVAARIVDLLKANARIWLGRGVQEASIRASYKTTGGEINPINVWSYGKLEINFKSFVNSPLRNETKRSHFLTLLNNVDGLNLAPDTVAGYASIPLKLFMPEAGFLRLATALAWMAGELRNGVEAS